MKIDISTFGEIVRTTKTDDFYNCPFCSDTSGHLGLHRNRGVYHCFRCNASGIISELPYDLKNFHSLVQEKLNGKQELFTTINQLELPRSFTRLNSGYTRPYRYLNRREITEYEMAKYSIGFCYEGFFANRIIVPIYYGSRLKYFVGRTYVNAIPKYTNAPIAKDDLVFKTFDQPVKEAVICEGIFDALKIGKVMPAIALLGKTISDGQLKRLLREKINKFIIMLDDDAKVDAFNIYQRLSLYRPCSLKLISEKDPGEMSIAQIREILQ